MPLINLFCYSFRVVFFSYKTPFSFLYLFPFQNTIDRSVRAQTNMTRVPKAILYQTWGCCCWANKKECAPFPGMEDASLQKLMSLQELASGLYLPTYLAVFSGDGTLIKSVWKRCPHKSAFCKKNPPLVAQVNSQQHMASMLPPLAHIVDQL